GQPQDRRERANGSTPATIEIGEPFMPPIRRGLPMVACDERHRLDLVWLEAPQIAVSNQIVRVLMMALVANVDADIVEERCIFQPLALAVREAVNHPCLVEERNREARDLLRMFRPVVAAFAKLDDAAAADVGVAVGLRDLLAMPR